MENKPKRLVFIPTLNEVENIRVLIEGISAQLEEVDILIVDDHSPDGTSEFIRKMMEEPEFQGHLNLVERPGRLGIGSAHRLAFIYAIEKGYDELITMDGDGSHDPAYLPTMVELLKENDFVIGSRFAAGGESDYVGLRRFMSSTANWFLKTFVIRGLNEFTTAFRGYRVSWLKEFPFKNISGQGYSFFFSCVYWVNRYKARMAEFPIHFKDRANGFSKINYKEILLGAYNVFRIVSIHFFRVSLPVQDMTYTKCKSCQGSYLAYEKGEVNCLACGSKDFE